jgi:hypothetical protein
MSVVTLSTKSHNLNLKVIEYVRLVSLDFPFRLTDGLSS